MPELPNVVTSQLSALWEDLVLTPDDRIPSFTELSKRDSLLWVPTAENYHDSTDHFFHLTYCGS